MTNPGKRTILFQPALPARGATGRFIRPFLLLQISTRAPREGSDIRRGGGGVARRLFQPALPARGATEAVRYYATAEEDFNPRSPRGERHAGDGGPNGWAMISTRAPREGSDRARAREERVDTPISTRAPREGSDATCSPQYSARAQFQPALPARGATLRGSIYMDEVEISTRAPREGSDFRSPMAGPMWSHFNPRSPRGERRGWR